jgi:hypothetical protein
VVVTGCNLLNFYTVLAKELHFFGVKIRCNVTVAERADLLGKHPAEHAFFSSIAPSPDSTLGVERD